MIQAQEAKNDMPNYMALFWVQLQKLDHENKYFIKLMIKVFGLSPRKSSHTCNGLKH
jgi:hypothetical protein